MRRFDSRHGRMMKNSYIIGLENVSPRNLTRYCKLQYALILLRIFDSMLHHFGNMFAFFSFRYVGCPIIKCTKMK